MPLTGEAKKKYQRDHMRKKRSNNGSNKPEGLTDGSNAGLTAYPACTPDAVTRQEFEELRERVRLLESAVSFLSKPKIQSVKQVTVESPYSRGAQASGRSMPYAERERSGSTRD